MKAQSMALMVLQVRNYDTRKTRKVEKQLKQKIIKYLED